MNTYGDQILQRLARHYKGSNYTVERVSETVLHCIPFWEAKPAVTTWLKEEETFFQQKFPQLTLCLIGEGDIHYELFVQDGSRDVVLTIELPDDVEHKGAKAICYVSEEETTFPVDDVMQLFKGWVQQLPAYRLRFVTGEWEMEMFEE